MVRDDRERSPRKRRSDAEPPDVEENSQPGRRRKRIRREDDGDQGPRPRQLEPEGRPRDTPRERPLPPGGQGGPGMGNVSRGGPLAGGRGNWGPRSRGRGRGQFAGGVGGRGNPPAGEVLSVMRELLGNMIRGRGDGFGGRQFARRPPPPGGGRWPQPMQGRGMFQSPDGMHHDHGGQQQMMHPPPMHFPPGGMPHTPQQGPAPPFQRQNEFTPQSPPFAGRGGRGTPATVPMRKHVDPELEERRRVARAAKVRAQLEGFPVLEDAAGSQIFQRFQRARVAALQPEQKALPLRSKPPTIEGLYFWPAIMPDESASGHYDGGVDPMRQRLAVISQFEQCVQEVHRDDHSLVESEVGSVVVT